MNSVSAHPTFLALLLVLLVLGVPLAFLYRKYLRVDFLSAVGIAMGSAIAGVLFMKQRMDVIAPMLQRRDQIDQTFIPVACILFFLILVPLVVRLIRAWLLDEMRDNERLTGADGVRAWLSVPHILCLVGLTFTGWYGYGISPWAIMLLGFFALVARPLIGGSLQADTGTSEGPASRFPETDPALKEERERILRMLESGTVKPEEATELLGALNPHSGAPVVNERQPVTAKQRLAFLGALLLVAGFVMPWFSFNLGEEMDRMGQQLGMHFDAFPQLAAGGGMFASHPLREITTSGIKVSGNQVGRGLGWLVLFCGMAAAVLGAVPRWGGDPSVRRMMILGALGLGALLLLYLLGNGIRHLSYGFLVTVLAYACIAVGASDSIKSGAAGA